MNINLLPDKFVKNRASEVILIGTIIPLALTIIILMFIFFFYQHDFTKYSTQVNNKRLEKVILEKEVDDLQQSQLVDLQEAIKELKGEQQLAGAVMASFSLAAKSVDATILTYTLAINEPIVDNKDVIGGDRSSLLPSIQISVRGDFFGSSIRFKEALEKLEWVYDVKPLTITREADYSEIDYIVRLKREEVPKLARSEQRQDD